MEQLICRNDVVENPRRGRCLLSLGAAVLSLVLGGCSSFYDDITAVSPEGGFWNNMQYRRELLFDRTPPLDVLAKSHDGDLRARAYRRLEEPKQAGGTEEDQNMMINLLTTAAKSEKDLICRVAAVEKLGEFKDPRANQALVDAFYAPANSNQKNPVVRVAVVKSLAQIGDPSSLQLLTEAVARDPAMDVRMAAADGLARYPNAQAAGALVKVLKEEKDVALRYQASISLQKITGKELPPQADQWEEYLQKSTGPNQEITKEPKSFLKLAAFWDE